MRTAVIFLLLGSAAAAQVTVSGTVRYEDRTYDATGFTGTAWRFVRQAEVELLVGGISTATGATDDTGAYSFSGVAAAASVQVRVYARRVGGQINAAVRNNPGANAIYTAITGPVVTAAPTTTVDLDLDLNGAGPVFNIFDCAVKTFQHLLVLEPGLAAVPPPMNVYWEANSPDGTYFDSLVNGIFLLGVASDPDEYDDDIILHEMGHWMATMFSKDDTLGGPHTVIDQLDPRTSWSEGLAHYWSATVRRSLPAEYVAPTRQVDTFASGFSVFDIEGPDYPTFAIMATNELAVVAALWDITDGGAGEAFDTVAGNEAELWRTLSVRMPPRTNITLEDFHAGLALEAPGIMSAVTGSAVLPGIFKDRSIRYYADAGEPNDAAGAPTVLPLGAAGLVERTIYAAGDEDWFSVAATPGTLRVETLNLGDGADTLLELYDATGATLLTSNDNRSFFDPSSQLEWPVYSPATYLVRVVRAGSLVEHGYYDVRAQSVRLKPPTPHEFEHRCGATGLEGLALLLLLRLRRRRC